MMIVIYNTKRIGHRLTVSRISSRLLAVCCTEMACLGLAAGCTGKASFGLALDCTGRARFELAVDCTVEDSLRISYS